MKPKKLSLDDARSRLNSLDGWQLDGEDAIRWKKTYEDFDDAMSAINQIADIARSLDHHPELENVYNEVELRLTTHDIGGLSQRDFDFADAVNAL